MNPSRTASALALLLPAGLALVGCASQPGPLPAEVEPARLHVVSVSTAPTIDVSGLPGGKLVGAGVGAGTGSGIGVLAGAAMCIATGPLFPVCVAALVPAGAAIGAVTGGAVGAARTESVEAMELKTKALSEELATPSYQTLMADRLRVELGDRPRDEPAGEQAWALEVGIAELGTEGKSEFALRLVARMKLRKGTAAPVWESAKEVQSDTELTSAQWLADDSKALRSVLGQCIEQAARQLATDLPPAVAGDPSAAPRPRAKYSTSCADVPLRTARS